MENKIIDIKAPEPLKLERKEELKAYAILSKHISLPHEFLNQKLSLSVVLAYSGGDAILGARTGLQQSGKNPSEYITPYMIIQRGLAGAIEFKPIDTIEMNDRKEALKQESEVAKESPQYGKSLLNVISCVRLVFDTVGTPSQKKTAESVIVKFEEYANGISRHKHAG